MKKIFIIILLVFLFIPFDAYFIEPNILTEKSETLNLPNWNKELNGLKIAVVSDLHIGTKHSKIKKLNKIIEKVNKKNPDLIFILGDYDAYFISNNYSPDEISNSLKKFKSKYGVISVLGNHDFRPAKVVKYCLKGTNIAVLENENVYLNIKNQRLKVTGLNDYWKYSDTEPKKVIGEIESPTIVLSHNPDLFVKVPKGVSLTLSGHTHGGEVILPIFGSPFVPSLYGQRFIKGHIIENGKHLFVTSGVATLSGFRFLNPPEIVFLALNSETEQQKDTKPKKGFKKDYQHLYLEIVREINAKSGI